MMPSFSLATEESLTLCCTLSLSIPKTSSSLNIKELQLLPETGSRARMPL